MEQENWKFYNSSIDELNERISLVEQEYTKTLNSIISFKQKLNVLNEYIEVKEGEYYVEIQQATDDIGKPLYKNEELRKIELKNRMKGVPQYQETKKIYLELPSLEANLELIKIQLNILTQEKEFRIKFGNTDGEKQ